MYFAIKVLISELLHNYVILCHPPLCACSCGHSVVHFA